MEARAGARVRATRAVLKPAETTPLTALLLAEILPGGRAAAGRGEHRPRATGSRAPRSCASRTSTRSPSPARPPSARTSRRRSPGAASPLTLELGGKSANIVFEDAALDQAVEGIVQGIFFNQGHVCCAGSRLLIQESVADDGRSRKLWARMARAARRRPARQEHRRGRHQLAPSSSSGSRRWWRAGEEEGAVRRIDRLRAARARLLVRADDLHRRRARAPDRGRGDLRPGRLGADLPHPGRGDREGEQLDLRPRGRASGPTRARRHSRWRARCRPASSGRTPTTTSTRPPPSAATRRAASAARAAPRGLRPYLRVS